jgi:hypothetical protein
LDPDRTSISVLSLELVFAGLGCSQYDASRVLTSESPKPSVHREIGEEDSCCIHAAIPRSALFGRRPEPAGIQALSSEGSVERFNESIVSQLARGENSILIPLW